MVSGSRQAGASSTSMAAPLFYTVGGTVTNFGTIASTYGTGIKFENGGTVVNDRNGLVQGATNGVDFGPTSGGRVTNAGRIMGTSGFGVDLQGGGTVIDSGIISGGNGTAIAFGGSASNLLVLKSGYLLDGMP